MSEQAIISVEEMEMEMDEGDSGSSNYESSVEDFSEENVENLDIKNQSEDRQSNLSDPIEEPKSVSGKNILENEEVDKTLLVETEMETEDKVGKNDEREEVMGLETDDMLEELKIGTHNGYFHADEVLAVSLLKFLNGDKQIKITRTRSNEILSQMDIVVDVGQIFDPVKNRFDHHQKSCTETFSENFKIPLSSAGMIYRHFGLKIIDKYFKEEVNESLRDEILEYFQDSSELENLLKNVYMEMYKRFVQEIDANDNGVPSIKDDFNLPGMYNYHQNLHLACHVKALNGPVPSDDEVQYEQFCKAMELMWKIFRIHLDQSFRYQFSYMKDSVLLKNLFDNRPHPNILIMDNNYQTWRHHLSDLDTNNEIRFTIYPRDTEGNNWGFSAMQVKGKRFTNQIDLRSYEHLRLEMKNPDDLIFVHKNLFCGAAKNPDSAFEVCRLSYEKNQKNASTFGNVLAYLPSLSKKLPECSVRTVIMGTTILSLGMFIGRYLKK